MATSLSYCLTHVNALCHKRPSYLLRNTLTIIHTAQFNLTQMRHCNYVTDPMNHFSFPIRTLWIDPLYYCILPLFFLYIHTTRHLLIDALYRHRPDRPWGAGGGSEDPGSVQGIQKQEQPEPTLSLPRFMLVREKLPFLEIIWASQVSRAQTPPKRIFKLCPYVGDCIVIYSISPYCVPLNTFYLYLTSSLILNKS